MPTVNIIGSGIMGMLSAHELLKKGFKVTLFDQGLAGQESTWSGGGIISPLFPWRYDDAVSHLAQHSQTLYSQTLNELKEFSDIDPEYQNSGMLILDCKDLDQANTWAKHFNVHLEHLDGCDLKNQFSGLNGIFEKAIWMPQIHQIRNPRFAQLTKQSLLNRGVTFRENCAITQFEIKHNRVLGIHSNLGSFQADITLICTGAWTGDLFKLINGDDNPAPSIHPVHGQMLLLKTDETVLKEIVLHDERYIIPRKDGHVLVGSTTEMIGFKKQTTTEVRDKLLNYALKIVPELQMAHIAKHWSGLRPGSIKGIPSIGAHPKIANLYVNAGHYRNGLVTAPASAQLIQQIISNETTDLNHHLFELDAEI